MMDLDYTIEYVPAGIVRSGRHDMTNWVLTYKDAEGVVYFTGAGVFERDTLVGYKLLLPDELKGKSDSRTKFVIEKIIEMVRSEEFKRVRHRNVFTKDLVQSA